MDRWENLCEAVASVRAQTVRVFETIIAIDHNPQLLTKAAMEFPDVTVVSNAGDRGASSARNAGVTVSHGNVLAFLDDDAVAEPFWLEVLIQHFSDPRVVGVGGRLDPLWNTCRPRWFPLEFDWVVGCSYRGMPENATRVRNVWGNNMAIRRDIFDAIGGFREGFGKVGDWNHPEDTDLCLRATEHDHEGFWLYEPGAVVGHQVSAERATVRYFVKRCYNEGHGKAVLASLNGIRQSTSTERRYAQCVLPLGVLRGIVEAVRGRISGMARSLAILVGVFTTVVGFLAARTTRQGMLDHSIYEDSGLSVSERLPVSRQ